MAGIAIFLDESGDLGFDFAKPGTSAYLTITILICQNEESSAKIRQAVKKTLKNKLNHKKSSIRANKELKGESTTLEIKKYFYSKLPQNGWGIYSVTVNKKRVTNSLKTKAGKKKLYNFLAKFLLEKASLDKVTGYINFVVDKCKNKKEIKDFNDYIANQLKDLLPLETKLNITHESSKENLCIQAVDLFCWGVARKHNNNDSIWYECFKEKVKYDETYLP